MKLITNHYRNLILCSAPLLIIGFLMFITTTSVFKTNLSSLSNAIIIDLLITVPLLYFLLIRKTKIPKTTVVPFIIVGMLICSFIIPTENQHYLSLFKTWIFPVIEILVITYIIYNVRKTIKNYKKHKEVSHDFFITLKNTCKEIIPTPFLIPVITEIAVFYYGVIYWKKRPLAENEFSYHKNSGSISLLIGLLLIIGIETITIHILLSKWNIFIAWGVTFLSIYSGFQIFGFLKSMTKRPILVENNKIFVRYGIMSETVIDMHDIKSIKVSAKDIELTKEIRKLSFLGELEAHNVIISLKKEHTLIGLYGIKKKFKTLALHIDEKDTFVSTVSKTLLQIN